MNNEDKSNWLVRFIKSAIAEFRHQPLGAVYYAVSILALAFGGVQAFIAYYSTDSTATAVVTHLKYAAIVLGVAIAITAPFLALRILRSRNPVAPALNENWESCHTSFDLEIRKDGRRVTRRDKLKAMSGVKVFIFRFRLTGTTAFAVQLVEPTTAQLSAAVHNHDSVLYQVEFQEQIAPNEIVELCIKYEVSDPLCTMKPYHSLAAANLHHYCRVNHKLRFPDEKPKGVVYEVADVHTGAIIGGRVQTLFPGANGEYNHEVIDPSRECSYIYSWSW